MLNHLLRGFARATFSPDTDEGFDDDAEALDTELEDAGSDEVLDDEGDGDATGGSVDSEDAGGDLGNRRAGDDQQDDRGQEALDQRPSRGQARFQALSERARRAEAEAAEATRRVNELLQRQSIQQSEAQRRAELERLEMMTPEERLEYRFAQHTEQTNRQLQAMQFAAADTADRATFQAFRASKPALSVVSDDEIEAALATMRQNGTNAPRETIAKYLFAEKMLAKQPRARAAGQRAAAAGRERQGVRPPATRGDVAGSRREMNEREARRQRLEDMEI